MATGFPMELPEYTRVTRFNVDIPQEVVTCTIPASNNLSNIIACGGLRLSGILMPSTWTQAVLTFKGGISNTDMRPLYDSFGNYYGLHVPPNGFVLLDREDMISVPFIQLCSGTFSAAVNQTAAAPITLILR